MKTISKIALTSLLNLASLTLVSASPVVVVPAPPPPEPVVTVPAPAPMSPVVTVEAAVPDYYVWDGYEYVGVVGDQYYYLGPGNAWILLDPGRWARFHNWERGHPDWRHHAVRNELYRGNAHGDRDWDHPDHDRGR